jgi:hypothetical protein
LQFAIPLSSLEMIVILAANPCCSGFGIYGTVSFVMNEQRREIVIRPALNSKSHYPQDGLAPRTRLAAPGAGLGIAGALIVSHQMGGLLYGVSPNHLPTFAGITLVLTSVTLAASYIPSLRTMRLDPITTLHSTPTDLRALSRLFFASCGHPNDLLRDADDFQMNEARTTELLI